MKIICPFPSLRSFSDPVLTEDGKPYRIMKYESIVNERYIICKYTHMTYEDTGKMTPKERQLILKFIKEDIERENEAIKSVTKK